MQLKISLFLIAFLTVSICGIGQNTISISPTSSTFTTISTPAGLTTRQTKSAALTVTMTPKSNRCLIFVSGSTTSPVPISRLIIKGNTAVTNADLINSGNVNEIPLSSTPVQVLDISKKNANVVVTFDLILDAIGWSVQGGSNYSFTVTFTMSPQ